MTNKGPKKWGVFCAGPWRYGVYSLLITNDITRPHCHEPAMGWYELAVGSRIRINGIHGSKMWSLQLLLIIMKLIFFSQIEI